MRKALILVITVLISSSVYKGLDRLLPPEVLGFSRFVVAAPASSLVLWLCLYPILGADKPFKRHVVAGVVGVLFGLIVAIAMDKLL